MHYNSLMLVFFFGSENAVESFIYWSILVYRGDITFLLVFFISYKCNEKYHKNGRKMY